MMSMLSPKSAAVTGTLICALGMQIAGSAAQRSTAATAVHATTSLTTPLPGAATMPLWTGADPWITRHDGIYWGCESRRNRISVWRSSLPTVRGEPHVIWRAPTDGWNSAEIWAPELHFVRGRWYVYYAASTGVNATHRMGVLECQGTDPAAGPWVDRGMLYTGDDPVGRRDNHWAIDGTILERGDQLYFVWSGWADDRDIQYLYIAPMSDPATVSGPRVRICANDDYDWERVGDDHAQRGLQEGPAFLRRNGRTFLIYSCSGSWQRTYKLGMLWAADAADPLDPRSWHKIAHPVFESSQAVVGVGHCSFTSTADGQDWIVYHAKTSRREGWSRVVRMQPFGWGVDGFPEFGVPGEIKETTVRRAG